MLPAIKIASNYFVVTNIVYTFVQVFHGIRFKVKNICRDDKYFLFYIYMIYQMDISLNIVSHYQFLLL